MNDNNVLINCFIIKQTQQKKDNSFYGIVLSAQKTA